MGLTIHECVDSNKDKKIQCDIDGEKFLQYRKKIFRRVIFTHIYIYIHTYTHIHIHTLTHNDLRKSNRSESKILFGKKFNKHIYY